MGSKEKRSKEKFSDYKPLRRPPSGDEFYEFVDWSKRAKKTSNPEAEEDWLKTKTVPINHREIRPEHEHSSEESKFSHEVPGRKKTAENIPLKRGHTLTYAALFLFTIILYARPSEMYPSAYTASLAFITGIATLLIFVPTQLGLDGTITVWTSEVKYLCFLTFWALLSMPMALSPGLAWETFSSLFVKAAVIFIVIVNVARTKKRLNGLIFLALGVGFVISLSALNDYRKGNFTVEGYRVMGNIGGMFGNPDDMALHLVTMIPIAVAISLDKVSLLKRSLLVGCALLMLAGTIFTFSRGGFLGLVAGVALLAWKLGRGRRFVAIIALFCGAIAFMLLAPGNYGTRILSILDHSLDPLGSANARTELLKTSVIVALRHPLLGIGIGNFPLVSIRDQVSHNAFTQVAAEMGLPALFFYVMFIATAFKKLLLIERDTLNGTPKPHSYYLAIGLQSALGAYIVGSFFVSVAYVWYAYYLVAYAVCLHRVYQSESVSSTPGVMARQN